MTAGVGMYGLAIAATFLVILCLEATNFIHHHIFKSTHPETDADENSENVEHA
jgi:putative Mg2+ transporter-C (MgtC) family protein